MKAKRPHCADEATDIVKAACKKYANYGNRTLARMIYDELTPEWKTKINVEALRSRVRAARGAYGEIQRWRRRRTIIPREGVLQPMPEGGTDVYAPYDFTATGRGLVLDDLHIPYHCAPALKSALRFARKANALDFVILGGDVCDFYALSDFFHNPTKKHFIEERDSFFRVMDVVRDFVGEDAPIIYKLGNHDARMEHYFWRQAPELFGIEETDFQTIMRFDDYNLTYVPASSPVRCGYLDIFHGHEWGGGAVSPVSPARTAYLKTSGITIVGHSHVTSEYHATTSRGVSVPCWSVGCMCDLHPAYRPVNGWNRGFALLSLDKNGFHVENRRINASNHEVF